MAIDTTAVVNLAIIASVYENWTSDTHMEDVLDADPKFEHILSRVQDHLAEIGITCEVDAHAIADVCWGRADELDDILADADI